MNGRNRARGALAAALLGGALTPTAHGAASMDAIEQTLAQLQAELTRAQQEIATLKAENQQIKQQVAATGEAVEQVEQTAAARGPSWAEKTSLGAYGEMHWNSLQSKDEIDFHRFVLFLGHEFDAKTRLFAELELEHSLAGEGKKGEVELEQAYIERDLADSQHARVGLFLIPVGILNEHHEPDTFYGVERNPVETNIIPTTWWEGGVGLHGDLAPGWGYDVAAHSGLKVPLTGSNAFLTRSGRQKVSEAVAEDPAITARIRYTAIPGLELALSGQFQDDLTQGLGQERARAFLWETHAVLQRGPFGLRALYAGWDIGGDQAQALGRDQQNGWYVEPSWRLNDQWGVFARYNRWDTAAGDSADSKFRQIDVGFNYWLSEQVVLKLDYMDKNGPSSALDDHGVNAGVGFSF
ncbi:porin [Immundisolibacter sp.]